MLRVGTYQYFKHIYSVPIAMTNMVPCGTLGEGKRKAESMQFDSIEECKWEILNRIWIYEIIDETRKHELRRRPY